MKVRYELIKRAGKLKSAVHISPIHSVSFMSKVGINSKLEVYLDIVYKLCNMDPCKRNHTYIIFDVKVNFGFVYLLFDGI